MRTRHWAALALAAIYACHADASTMQQAPKEQLVKELATVTAANTSVVAAVEAANVALGGDTHSIVNTIDDSACVFKWRQFACVPTAYCSYQYRFGDLTLDQSCRLATSSVGRLPQQVHLAFAGDVVGTGMTISWTTYTKVDDPAVWIGKSVESLAVPAPAAVKINVRSYYQEGSYALYSYHATVTNLSPRTTYYYKVGSQSQPDFQSRAATSASFTTARSASADETFEIAVYGDFGVDTEAKETLAYVNTQLVARKVDFIYHIGDISYADNAFLSASEFFGFFYEETYNRWMNALTPVMQALPYMVLVGNHEAECHSPACIVSNAKKDALGYYNAYNARFQMPSAESNGVKNMWYSFEHGPLHITSVSSETDYATAPSNAYLTGRTYGGYGDQLAWLEADLKKADANRANVPWIIVGMHRAIYTLDKCDARGNPTGEALAVQKGFEDLLLKYKVDAVVAGHVHTYERHYPIARNQPVLDGVSPDRKVYTNPKAPVYITTGAAGNSEGHQTYDVANIPWNVVIDIVNYGISLLEVNRTALTWRYVATATGAVVDEFTIVKA